MASRQRWRVGGGGWSGCGQETAQNLGPAEGWPDLQGAQQANITEAAAPWGGSSPTSPPPTPGLGGEAPDCTQREGGCEGTGPGHTHPPAASGGGGFRGARTWHAGLCVPSQTTSLVLQASETARAPSVSLAGGGDLEPLAGWTVVLGSRPCSSGGSGFGKITKVAQGPPAASPRSPGAGSSVMSPETRTVSTPSFCRAGSPFPVRSQLRLSDEGTPSTGWGRRLGLRVKVPARGCLMERDKGYGPLTGYKLSQND